MADRSRNPRNEASPLFRRLTKLFSGPLVNYDAQVVVRNSRTDIDKFASKIKSVSGQQFKKASYNPFSNLSSATMANVSRSQRYIDFDQMEFEPIIASALDIYADEMTTSSHLNPLLRIHCSGILCYISNWKKIRESLTLLVCQLERSRGLRGKIKQTQTMSSTSGILLG